ncbi:hypothetical protein M407DRAFT_232186 [Tulasnella calospora MUT 4182]|uniref:XPG-I domain-containing protein n=1 Tax=Tulasnella calospora MUT 4182 TaxID=1051891 RepID=A0A0C3QBD9_9AGAM|nr:hypothetical protein M407DRAFT_232186 [Tulasnella calospora MUT 4182]
MGVPGLWDLLRPAAEKRSLIHLAVIDGFEKNLNGQRGYRIGIDASIWFFHSEWGKEGENPELRTLFFRLCRLAEAPFLPLFVFDGPYRPSFKRGKNINGQRQHWLQSGFKRLIEAFGWEWRQAPGEAEAELAYLNRIGKIDAVLSDDVDNFLFGARVVVRNSSNTLSGNRSRPVLNADGRDDGKHTMVFRAEEFENREDIDLTQNGMILIGLLSGGDYHAEGVSGCGKLIAHGLARCGFGESLVDAFLSMEPSDFEAFLGSWRAELIHELKTNSRGLVGKKYVALAKKVPEDFPNIEVLRSYVTPVTSESRGKEVDDSKWWTRDMDVAEVAACCEMFFEWGVKEIIIKRFRTVLWPGACNRILRQAAREQDMKGESSKDDRPGTPQKKRPPKHLAVGTPSKLITRYFSKIGLNTPEKVKGPLNNQDDDEDPLMIKIHSTRNHASTDHILEYRVEVAPAQLVALAESGVKGTRRIEDLGYGETFSDLESDGEGNGKKRTGPKAPPNPSDHLRVWLPALMMEYVQPSLVEEFEAKEDAKRAKKEGKGKGRKKADGKAAIEEAPKKKKTPQKKATVERRLWESTDDEEAEEKPAPKVTKPKAAVAPKDADRAAVGRARRIFDSSEEGSDADVPARLQKSQQPNHHQVASGSGANTAKVNSKAQFAFTMPRPDDSDDDRERSTSPSPLHCRVDAMPPKSTNALAKPLPPVTKSKPAVTSKGKATLGARLAQEQLAALQKLPAAARFFDSDEGNTLEDPFIVRKPAGPSRSSTSSSTAVSKLSGSSESTAVSEIGETVTAPKKARPSPRRSSSSEDSGKAVTKSPRKTKKHTSPRKMEERLRPASPTAKRPLKAKAPPKVMEYIEIVSSDEDAPAPLVSRNPPGPRATSKPPSRAGSESRTLGSFGFAVTKGGAASMKASAKQQPKPRKLPVIPDDIIDLT